MRRVGNLWSSVATFGALVRAAQVASRGKRRARTVARFLERVEPECLALERELTSGTWRPGPVARFLIHDPKTREITVTPFRDQVVHHALMGALEPVFERRMIAHSFACRRGKGMHAAVALAQRSLRANGYFLKMDVKSFFASVRHDLALETVARVVKDRRVLDLVRLILNGPAGATASAVGLPLGTLTSQWIANLILDRLDHFVKERLRCRGYVRYMDDFVLFGNSRSTLREAHDAVRQFLAAELKLALKDRATMLAPAITGLPFLGWLIFPGTIRVRPENLRRYRWRLRQRRFELERGTRTPSQFRAGVASLFELLRHGDTLALRRSWVARARLEI